MGRKSAQNQWSEGMIKDLNPINVPNNVLTDCLNGTIITYNGNEFSLQNDMGNYPLSNCKLKEGFIPIGLKEYAGILYIVSYNPLTEETEIGSYPSTKTDVRVEQPLNTQDIETIELKGNYTDLVKQIKNISFYPFTNDYVINPNDEYSLELDTEDAEYQELKYYILDSDKNLFDISDKVKVSKEAHKVTWQVPGWFIIRNRIAELNSFFITTPVLNTDVFTKTDEEGNTYGSASGIIKFAIQTYDNLFTSTEFTKIREDLQIKYEVYLDDVLEKEETISLNENGEYMLYNKAKSYIATTAFSFDKCTPDSKIRIEAVPILKEMTYDNMRQSYSFVLKNMNSVDNIDIGTQTWKYTVDSSSNTLTLYFDTLGVNSISQKDNLELYYTIEAYNKKTSQFEPVYTGMEFTAEDGTVTEATAYRLYCAAWNKDGFDTNETISMVPYVHIEMFGHYIDEWNYLFPENIYRIRFDICEKIPDDDIANFENYIKKTIYKVVIASEIMNDFEDAKYDEIPFDTWFNKYKDYVKNKTIKLESYEVASEEDVKFEENAAYSAWKNGGSITKYKTFVDSDVVADLGKSVNLRWSIPYILNLHCDSDVKMLNGPLWDSILEGAVLTDSFDSTQKLHFDKYTGSLQKTDGSSMYSRTVENEYSKEISYTPNILRTLELCDYTIDNVTSVPLMVSTHVGNRDYDKSYTKITFNAMVVPEISTKVSWTIKSPKGSPHIYNDQLTSNNLNDFLLKQLDKYDIIKCALRPYNTGSNDTGADATNCWSVSYFYPGYFNGNSEADTQQAVRAYYDSSIKNIIYLYCFVLKSPDNVPFYLFYSANNPCWDETTDTKAESNWNTFYEKIISNFIKVKYDDHVIYGSFVKLNGSALESEQSTSKISTSGYIDMANVDYTYNGFNLITKNDREQYILALTNNNKLTSLNTYNLNNISMMVTLPDVITLDSIDMNVGVSLTNKTKLEEYIANTKNEITNLNSEIDIEYTQCIADKYQSTLYTGESRYYDNSQTGIVEPTQKYILDILNWKTDNSLWTSEKLLYGASCGYDSGYAEDRQMGVYIGETNDDWNHFKLKK